MDKATLVRSGDSGSGGVRACRMSRLLVVGLVAVVAWVVQSHDARAAEAHSSPRCRPVGLRKLRVWLPAPCGRGE